MAHAFTRVTNRPGAPAGETAIVGRLDDVERSLVIELLHQTSVLLSDGSDDAPGVSSGTTDANAEDELFASLSRSMTPREAPSDPAVRRLLPDGVKGDDEAAREFRRLTESTLRTRKLANLDTAMRAFERGFLADEEAAAVADEVYAQAAEPGREPGGGATGDRFVAGAREVVLTPTEARAAMMAITDVRLVLAERLGLRTDEDADALSEQLERDAPPQSPEELLAAYYDFLTWMSESITLAVMGQA